MGEVADEQVEENARRMQQPDQKDALAGRHMPHPGDVHKGFDHLRAPPGFRWDKFGNLVEVE